MNATDDILSMVPLFDSSNGAKIVNRHEIVYTSLALTPANIRGGGLACCTLPCVALSGLLFISSAILGLAPQAALGHPFGAAPQA